MFYPDRKGYQTCTIYTPKFFSVEGTRRELVSVNYGTTFRLCRCGDKHWISKCIAYNCFYLKVILDTCLFLEEPEKQKDRLIFIFSDVRSLSHTFYSDIEEVTTNIIIVLGFPFKECFLLSDFMSKKCYTISPSHCFFETCCWLFILLKRCISLYFENCVCVSMDGRDFLM